MPYPATGPLLVPTQVPTFPWTLLNGAALNPYGGSAGGTIITTGGPALQLSNTWFFETYIVNQTVPGAITLTLEVDNLVPFQEFTVTDGRLDADVNFITVNFNGKLCNGLATRAIVTAGGSETYVWDGTNFHVKV